MFMNTEYPKKFLDLLNSVDAKRPKTVIKHILSKGFITSQELKDNYGYNHPPRAIRDVREYGIPIVTYRVEGNDGRSIAAYRFGDPNDIQNLSSKKAGRTVLSKELKSKLIEKYGARCFIYNCAYEENLLQVDHRIPYEINGECNVNDINNFMLLSPSANRSKSWICENCVNWTKKDIDFCKTCFWSHPENYKHIAGKEERFITIVFTQDEIAEYEKFIKYAKDPSITLKQLLSQYNKVHTI